MVSRSISENRFWQIGSDACERGEMANGNSGTDGLDDLQISGGPHAGGRVYWTVVEAFKLLILSDHQQ